MAESTARHQFVDDGRFNCQKCGEGPLSPFHNMPIEAYDALTAQNAKLRAALLGLMPEGWGDDDTMDHMPGIKAARLALLAKGGE